MKDERRLLVLAAIVGIAIFSNAPAQEDYSGEGECISDFLSPVKGQVGYTFITDYMFRGLNMSDILGGHVGRGNHELMYGISVGLSDLGISDVGTLGITMKHAFLGHYQNTSANYAKTDFSASLTMPCSMLEAVDGQVSIVYRNYKWHNQNTYPGGDERTQEFSFGLAFNDAPIIEALTGKTMDKSLLNPTVELIVDYELADGGMLWLFGMSHPLDMAEYMPELAGITLTPALTIAVDNRYYGSYVSNLTGGALPKMDTTKFAYFDWGVMASADLSEPLGITCGSLGIKGGVGYVQAFEKLAPKVLHDNLYSYVSLVYEW